MAAVAPGCKRSQGSLMTVTIEYVLSARRGWALDT